MEKPEPDKAAVEVNLKRVLAFEAGQCANCDPRKKPAGVSLWHAPRSCNIYIYMYIYRERELAGKILPVYI